MNTVHLIELILATFFFSACNMFVYMKQKIQWRMFAKTCNLIGWLEMKSRLWLDKVETPNRPPEAHARWTHSEVQPRKYCLGQSAKSKIPYHLIICDDVCQWLAIGRWFLSTKKRCNNGENLNLMSKIISSCTAASILSTILICVIEHYFSWTWNAGTQAIKF